jgi:hypothetical protein
LKKVCRKYYWFNNNCLQDDLEDANKNVVIALEEVVHQSECPNLVAQEENANLDFAGKFVQPTSASFTIPINDLLFKNKRCQLDRDEDDGNKNGGKTFFS